MLTSHAATNTTLARAMCNLFSMSRTADSLRATSSEHLTPADSLHKLALIPTSRDETAPESDRRIM